MIELGQLEAKHQDFTSRNIRIVAASVDRPEEAAKTQQQFPHITIVSDAEEQLMRATGMLGPQKSPEGKVIADPTTVLVNRTGTVDAILRADRYINRPTPDEVLSVAQKHLHESSRERERPE